MPAFSALLYGNYFLGICAVAQGVETAWLLGLPWKNVWLLHFVFAGTVLFYTYPYARKGLPVNRNPRTQWYRQHLSLVYVTQAFFAVWLAVSGLAFGLLHAEAIGKMEAWEWSLLVVFPLVGFFYYGGSVFSCRFNLRRMGWLKPFLIGFVWTGPTFVYPILFARIQYGHHLGFSLFPCLLFLKYFMFISVLAILFDIKDTATDTGSGLDTWVVRYGLRSTLFHVTLPLSVLGVLTFLSYAFPHGFSLTRMLMILAPFGLLMLAIVSLRKPRSLLYYYVVIDGLMLAKALFGIGAVRFG